MPDGEATTVKPNRRGIRSRELVLDAAERVMARDGFEAATLARVVDEAGVPLSSVYHYYGSKEGVLLAAMQRGAARFFTDLPDRRERAGSPTEHLRAVIADVVEALERHPDFLRLLIVFAIQPPTTGKGEVAAVVDQVRQEALRGLRTQLAIAFGGNKRSRAIDRLARFALAAVDGAFVAARSDRSVSLAALLEPLPDALVVIRRRERSLQT